MSAKNPRDPTLCRAVTNLAEKAEKLDQGVVTAAFVDMGHLSRIRTPATQYIEGRRGTGKTHLLMFLAEDVTSRVADDGTIAAYLDIRELRVESGASELDARGTAKRIYRDILSGILARLREINSKVLWNNQVPTERDAYDKMIVTQSENALAALERSIRGKPHATGPTVGHESLSSTSRVSESTGIAVGADSALPHLTALRGIAQRDTNHDRSSSNEQSTQYELRISFADIRTAIEGFLAVNDLSLLYICIDEWSSIPLAAQPFLAEYMKRTFLTSRKIALKIAVLPFQARLNSNIDGEQIGFERGGDIFAALDLDNELVFSRHPDRAISLLGRLLYNHLVFIAEQDPKKDRSSPPIFASADEAQKTIFSQPAFRKLLLASQGNPRDFLVLFRYAYLQFFDSSSEKVGAPHVDAGAKAFGIEKLENLRESQDAQRLFNTIVAEILQKHRQIAFLVHSRHANNTALQHLVHQRALHVWDESYSSPNFAGERFLVLSIDYCIIVEHLKSPNYRTTLELPFTEEAMEKLAAEKNRRSETLRLLSMEKPDKRTVRYIVLPDSAFTLPSHQRCWRCSEEFLADHPVVRRAGICPHCATPIDSNTTD